LDNAAKTIDWYKKALGAEELSRSIGSDGKVMHAVLKIGNSCFMMNDVMMGQKGPKALGGSPASLWIFVGPVRFALQPRSRWLDLVDCHKEGRPDNSGDPAVRGGLLQAAGLGAALVGLAPSFPRPEDHSPGRSLRFLPPSNSCRAIV
jgi:hypothetical protein